MNWCWLASLAQTASTSFGGRSSAAATAADGNSVPTTLAASNIACASGLSRSRLCSIISTMLGGVSILLGASLSADPAHSGSTNASMASLDQVVDQVDQEERIAIGAPINCVS